MHVLIAYGSKRGGTAGLAVMIGDALRDAGLAATASPAPTVKTLEGYDAVIVAGALYASRWHRDARRFIRRHTEALRRLPVWLVSSGPLDDSALAGDIPPVKHAAAAMSRIGARGHVTFGGRLAPDAQGFPASSMAKTRAGDWRDPAHVRRWVASVVDALAHRSETG